MDEQFDRCANARNSICEKSAEYNKHPGDAINPASTCWPSFVRVGQFCKFGFLLANLPVSARVVVNSVCTRYVDSTWSSSQIVQLPWLCKRAMRGSLDE